MSEVTKVGPLLTITGFTAESLCELRITINDILSSHNDQATKQRALEVLTRLAPSSIAISNNVFTLNAGDDSGELETPEGQN